MADEVIETTATPAHEETLHAAAPEETHEEKLARITAEVNEYLLKNGLQLQVEHRVILKPVAKAE